LFRARTFVCAISFAAVAAISLQSQTPASSTTGETLWVKVGQQRLKSRLFKSSHLSNHPTLIVILHGDSPRRPPSYQYLFAQSVAESLDDTIAAAVLRSGYQDDVHDRSDGERGLTTGDNYTPEVVDSIAGVVDELKRVYRPSRVILAGHSGGAAIVGNLLGAHPGQADGALMVSCPCDLTAWRKHMGQVQGGKIWEAPVRSLSPIDLVPKIPAHEHVRMIVGANDSIAPVELTQSYASALRGRGVDVAVTVAPGLEHDILREPVVLTLLKSLVEIVPRRSE